MVAIIRCEVEVGAPAEHVWDYVTDWPRQGEWIPLTRVEAEGARQIGGLVRAFTGIGGIGFWDTMTITSWDTFREGRARCEVLHTGSVIRGEGEFSVRSNGSQSCTFTWSERLVVPGGPLGELAWKVFGPLARKGARSTAERMADLAQESYAAR